MPKAICEDCGSLVEAELTHNGVCAVGHYVHCGWGHELSPDDLISNDVSDRIEELDQACAKWAEVSQNNYQRAKAAEANLAKAQGALHQIAGKKDYADDPWGIARTTLAELKGQDDGQAPHAG